MQGKQLTLWLNHQDRVTHVEMSPDGMALASSSWDETIRVRIACYLVSLLSSPSVADMGLT